MVLVLENKQLHLYFQRGHFTQNSYRIFEETSKELFHGTLSSSSVTEITDWVVCLINLALVVIFPALECAIKRACTSL